MSWRKQHKDQETEREEEREERHHTRRRSSFRSGAGPQKSVEGWVIFVTNIHSEAQEEDVVDTFSEYGRVTKINLNMDRRTGQVKGYALVEFGQFEEAQDAINALHGKEMLGKQLGVHWAFVKPTGSRRKSR